jgi:hypothetical protein
MGVFTGFGVSLLLATTVCLAAQAVPTAAGVVEAPEAERSSKSRTKTFTRVRSEQVVVRQVLADGYARSQAFRNLIQTIERSNLLVYVIWTTRLSGVGGSLQVPGAANGQRVVFILINRKVPFVQLIPMVAHELQHAVEIANAPDVVDRASLVRYYERIGERVRIPLQPFSPTFDTAAARAIAAVVLSELRAADGMGVDDSSGHVANADGNRPPLGSGEGSRTEPNAEGP